MFAEDPWTWIRPPVPPPRLGFEACPPGAGLPAAELPIPEALPVLVEECCWAAAEPLNLEMSLQNLLDFLTENYGTGSPHIDVVFQFHTP